MLNSSIDELLGNISLFDNMSVLNSLHVYFTAPSVEILISHCMADFIMPVEISPLVFRNGFIYVGVQCFLTFLSINPWFIKVWCRNQCSNTWKWLTFFCFVWTVSRDKEQPEEARLLLLSLLFILIAWQEDRGEVDTRQQESEQISKPRTPTQLLSGEKCFQCCSLWRNKSIQMYYRCNLHWKTS